MVRAVDPRSKESSVLARDASILSRSVGAGLDGEVLWVRDGPDGVVVEGATAADVTPKSLGRLSTPTVQNLTRTEGGFALVVDKNDDMKVALYRQGQPAEDLLVATDIIDSAAISFDEGTIVAHTYPEPGESGDLVVVTDGKTSSFPVGGSGISSLALSPQGDSILFVDIATAALMASDLEFGQVRKLRDGVRAAQLSSDNELAWIPTYSSGSEIPVCIDRDGG